MSQQVRFV